MPAIQTWLHEVGISLETLRAALLLVVGLLVAGGVGRLLNRALRDRIDRHRMLLLRRGVTYSIVALFVVAALREVGFGIEVLLGAAGILSVAIGFASQTSASNLVSGLFMIGEQPFSVGDVIRVGSTTGEVLSIDLLSVKLRTFDNLYVRIPNESLIKSELTNLSRFPIRRIDLPVSVAYKDDLREVERILAGVADANPLSLDDPAPLFILTGYGDSGINIQFSVWTSRENFLALRNALYREIKEAFDAAGIEIPFPHRSLYAGAVTAPLPVRLVGDEAPTSG